MLLEDFPGIALDPACLHAGLASAPNDAPCEYWQPRLLKRTRSLGCFQTSRREPRKRLSLLVTTHQKSYVQNASNNDAGRYPQRRLQGTLPIILDKSPKCS